MDGEELQQVAQEDQQAEGERALAQRGKWCLEKALDHVVKRAKWSQGAQLANDDEQGGDAHNGNDVRKALGNERRKPSGILMVMFFLMKIE